MFPITITMEESLRSLWMRFKFNQEGRVLYRLLHFFHPTGIIPDQLSSAYQTALKSNYEDISKMTLPYIPLPDKPPIFHLLNLS